MLGSDALHVEKNEASDQHHPNPPGHDAKAVPHVVEEDRVRLCREQCLMLPDGPGQMLSRRLGTFHELPSRGRAFPTEQLVQAANLVNGKAELRGDDESQCADQATARNHEHLTLAGSS